MRTFLQYFKSRLTWYLTTLLMLGSIVMINPAYASFHGKNGIIAMECSPSTAFEDICVMNADGSNIVNLTNTHGASRNRMPKWSPDGTKIVFSSNRGGTNQLYVMDANGTNVMQLTNVSTTNIYPNWSPDGSKIAFMSNRNSTSAAVNELFVMNADGSNAQQLTFQSLGQRASQSPMFTKGGKKIIFTMLNLAANVSIIYSINIDGTDLLQITDPSDAAAEEYMGNINPNNTRLAFMDFSFTQLSKIYVSVLKRNAGEFLPIARADSIQVTNDGNNSYVAFSPDGKYLLIQREPNVTVPTVTFLSDIYVLDMKLLKKGNIIMTNLTNGNGTFRYSRPDWQPIPGDDESND